MYNIVSMENNYCFKCEACCNKIAVDFSKRIIYRDGIQTLTKEFEAMLIPVEKREDITFCSCKFLKNKLCINPDKPQECTNYPSSPFAFLPEGCGAASRSKGSSLPPHPEADGTVCFRCAD